MNSNTRSPSGKLFDLNIAPSFDLGYLNFTPIRDESINETKNHSVQNQCGCLNQSVVQMGKFSDDNEKNKRALKALRCNYDRFQSKIKAQSLNRSSLQIDNTVQIKNNSIKKCKLRARIKKHRSKQGIIIRLERDVRMLKQLKVNISRNNGIDSLNDLLLYTLPLQFDHLKDSLYNNNNKYEEIFNSNISIDKNKFIPLSDIPVGDDTKLYLKEVKSLVDGYYEFNNYLEKFRTEYK